MQHFTTWDRDKYHQQKHILSTVEEGFLCGAIKSRQFCHCIAIVQLASAKKYIVDLINSFCGTCFKSLFVFLKSDPIQIVGSYFHMYLGSSF